MLFHFYLVTLLTYEVSRMDVHEALQILRRKGYDYRLESRDSPILLFERYYLWEKKQRKIGSGLGLYICHMILMSHHGSIQTENLSDKGCLFRLKLPLEDFLDEQHKT